MTRSAHSCWFLTGIFAIAFGLRLVATVMFEGLPAGPSRESFGADGVEFNAIAANLVRHGEFSIRAGHPTSFRAPGFPFALAAVYAVTGADDFRAARLFQCSVGALLCLAVYMLAREMTTPSIGLASAALVAGYPNVLYYALHFASEPLYTLLLTASVWLCVRGVRRSSTASFAWSGTALGLAALTRPVAFYFGPLFAVAVLGIDRRQPALAARHVAAFCLALLVPVVPWAVRNYQVHDRWLPFTSNGGSTFWGSNNQIVLDDPRYRGQWVSTERLGPQKDAVRSLVHEVDRDRLEWAFGKQFVRVHLADLPRLTWYKFREFWTPVGKTPNHAFNLIVGLSYGAAIPFMLGGLWLAIRTPGRDTQAIIIVLTAIAGTLLSGLVFYGSARFRSTIEPLLLIFAAVALTRLLSRLVPLDGSPPLASETPPGGVNPARISAPVFPAGQRTA